MTEWKEFIASPQFRAIMESHAAELNAKLEAAGLKPTGHNDFWRYLEAFARIDLHLTSEEFWSMTQADFEPFLDRYVREQARRTLSTMQKPSDWDGKPDTWKAFGAALLLNRSWGNDRLTSWVDKYWKVDCPYDADSWSAALADSVEGQKVHKLIGRVRGWLGIPGPGKSIH